MLCYFLYALADFLSLRVQFSDKAEPVAATGGGCGHPALLLGFYQHIEQWGSCPSFVVSLALHGSAHVSDFSL